MHKMILALIVLTFTACDLLENTSENDSHFYLGEWSVSYFFNESTTYIHEYFKIDADSKITESSYFSLKLELEPSKWEGLLTEREYTVQGDTLYAVSQGNLYPYFHLKDGKLLQCARNSQTQELQCERELTRFK